MCLCQPKSQMRANERTVLHCRIWSASAMAKNTSCEFQIICHLYNLDTSLCGFNTDHSGTLRSALSLNKPIYILGDLNCNVLNTNYPGQSALLNFCNCLNLTQLVEEPTRITEHSRTLIVILTTTENNVKQT